MIIRLVTNQFNYRLQFQIIILLIFTTCNISEKDNSVIIENNKLETTWPVNARNRLAGDYE